MEGFQAEFIIANMFIVGSFFIPETYFKILMFLMGSIWLFMGWLGFKHYLRTQEMKHKLDMLKTNLDMKANEQIVQRLDYIIEEKRF